MAIRHITDVWEYLKERLPNLDREPEWLFDNIADMLFHNGEYRLMEETDCVSRQEVVITHFRSSARVPQYSVEMYGLKVTLSDEPIDVRGERKFLHYNQLSGFACGGPLEDLLLLGERWPMTFTETPHQVMLVKKANLGRTLSEQLAELRANATT